MSGSLQPEIEEDGRWFRAVVCLVALVIGVIVIYEVYRFHRHDELSAQAINLGKTFIHSSPVVEENLGTVKAVKETSEKHRTARSRAGTLISMFQENARAASSKCKCEDE
jgi:hypothetical protein